jgi:hypothetical protein
MFEMHEEKETDRKILNSLKRELKKIPLPLFLLNCKFTHYYYIYL